MRDGRIKETDLVNISSVDISCDIIPPGSEEVVEVGGVNLVVHVRHVGQPVHSPTLLLRANPAIVSTDYSPLLKL